MSLDWNLVAATIFGPGFFTSSMLGFIIGAFYGYDLARDLRITFPIPFWSAGLAFVVSLGILGATNEAPITPEQSIGRAVLWTILCLWIPFGRWVRVTIHLWRLRRRTKKLEE